MTKKKKKNRDKLTSAGAILSYAFMCPHAREFMFVGVISLTAQHLASPYFTPLSCHHIHILLLFPAPPVTQWISM